MMDKESNNEKKPIESRQGLKLLLINALKETCASTTMHAIPNILRESSHFIFKVIWIICFLICSGFCLYYVIDAIQNYLTFPTVITRSIVQEIPSQFPKVSFCNNKFTNISLSYDFIDQFKIFKVNSSNKFVSLLEWDYSTNYLLKTYLSHPSVSDGFRKSIGYNIEDMLISCYFNYNSCNASDFTYFYSPLYGNCYTFNGGVFENGSTYPIKTVSSNGLFFGLTHELFIGDPYNN